MYRTTANTVQAELVWRRGEAIFNCLSILTHIDRYDAYAGLSAKSEGNV